MTDKYMTFSFNYTAQEKVYQTRQNLDKKKTCQENDILVKIIKSHYDTFSYFIIHKIKKKKKKKNEKKNTLVSRNAGDEENIHPGGRKFIFFS